MRFVDNKIKKLQQGGMVEPMPAEAAPAPAPGGQDQMMAQLEQMAMEIIQSVGPEAAAVLAEMIMGMLQQGAAPQEQPVFRKGGKMKRKNCK